MQSWQNLVTLLILLEKLVSIQIDRQNCSLALHLCQIVLFDFRMRNSHLDFISSTYYITEATFLILIC